ncbi:MAG: UvrD-helicase domain-containing protein [Chloroflexi bacterium]|nr:UvrD-helicase domain-containing protein [Chloroflexota bacterium]
MAHMMPETLPTVLPGEVLKTFKVLKALPDTFYIWHHLAPWQSDAPDFLMITHEGKALLVKVSTSSTTQATPAAQLLLIDDDRLPFGAAETAILTTFLEKIQLPDDVPLETITIFPNVPHKQVLESRLKRAPGEPHWAGRELLQPDSGIKWEDFFPPRPIEVAWIEKIRQCFTPEVVVPAEMTVRSPHPRRLEAGLTNYLLDYNQEAAVKADLDIEPDGQALSNDFRLNIINGVAGSGKTLILLYRLRLLYHLYPNKQFLVLTHNRPLSHDIQSRFSRLEGHLPDRIEWRTFNAWCYHHWPRQFPWVDPLSIRKRERIIRAAWQNTLADSKITEHMLLSEIDWIKDQLPLDKESYLTADRRGRGFSLTAEQRQQMWAAVETYQQMLEQQGALDWGDVPQRLWKCFEEEKVELPQYDIVLVDEAQFFAPLWVNLIQKALKPQNSHLFLVADPTQGFLGRKATWKSLGLEARGRSHLLRRSYRTTREIMQFATLFYRLRLSAETDEDILAPDMLNMPDGAFPQVISLTSAQDEIARVANEVTEFLRQGYPRNHLLILHANGEGCQALTQAIDHRLGKNTAMDPKETYPGNYVRVTTLNAGAGLESPIVFLVGLRELFEEEQSIRLSDDEREEIIRDNTRKVYMAATRAGQRLVFTYVGDLPEMLKQVFALSPNDGKAVK